MLKNILSTVTFRQSQITIFATAINGGLGALFYIVLARFLGPSDFGLLIIALTVMILIADIADLGTNTGIIRFVPPGLAEKSDKVYRFLKLSLKIKIIAWIVSFFLIFFMAPFLANEIFHKGELVLPLRLAGFGVGAALLFSYATSALQAYQKYFTWGLVNIFTNGLRLLLILFLGYYSLLNVENSLIIYLVLPFFGFFITLFLLPAKRIFQAKKEHSLLKDLLRYNVPVALFSIIAAISARLDTFLNAALLPAKEVGIYGAASQLLQIMPQIVSALGLVSSPKFASFQNNSQMLTYFKKFQAFVSGLVFLGILTIPLSIYFIPILLGPAYSGAVTPFVILFLGQLIFLFSIPVHHSIIFYFGRPDVFIWISIGHLILTLGLGYLMISNFGMIGASITVLIGMIFNFIYPLIWLLFKLRRR